MLREFANHADSQAIHFPVRAADIHDNVFDFKDAKIDVGVSGNIDTDKVKPGDTIKLELKASDNVFLVEPTATNPSRWAWSGWQNHDDWLAPIPFVSPKKRVRRLSSLRPA